MTIDEHVANQRVVGQSVVKGSTGRLRHFIAQLKIDDAGGGVNYRMVDADASGLLVISQQYRNTCEVAGARFTGAAPETEARPTPT